MRPDEHKKKRSAQYKKKHGMTKNDEAKDTRQQKGKGGKVKVDHHSKQTAGSSKDTSIRNSQSLRQLEEESSSASDNNNDDTGAAHSARKTFSRREIVSNWAKYEILPQEIETTQKRGEDFSKIISSAGSTSAQFRFKAEEDWDDGENVGTDAELLAVDLSDLSTSLQCIPLYERLGVEKELFSTEQIEEMESEAKRQQDQYVTTPPTDNRECVKKDNSDLAVKHTDKENNGNKRTPSPFLGLRECLSNKLNTKESPSPKSGVKEKTVGGSGCANFADSPSIDNTPVINTPASGDTVSKALEDDLDFLLSLDNHSDLTGPGEVTEAIDEKSRGEPAGAAAKEGQKKHDAENETQNLEDWLDSVLD